MRRLTPCSRSSTWARGCPLAKKLLPSRGGGRRRAARKRTQLGLEAEAAQGALEGAAGQWLFVADRGGGPPFHPGQAGRARHRRLLEHARRPRALELRCRSFLLGSAEAGGWATRH